MDIIQSIHPLPDERHILHCQLQLYIICSIQILKDTLELLPVDFVWLLYHISEERHISRIEHLNESLVRYIACLAHHQIYMKHGWLGLFLAYHLHRFTSDTTKDWYGPQII